MQRLPDGYFDLVAVGETLVDFISEAPVTRLQEATTFRRFLGGSPANIALYVAKLGGKAAVVSKIGRGGFGQFVRDELQGSGVHTGYLVMDRRLHTSVVFVTRSSGTPEFEALRSADYQLTAQEVAPEAIERARVVHASTFALSREPSRSAVRRAFELAQHYGKTISLDPNYSSMIWPDEAEAKTVLAEMFRFATMTKPSLDDAQRLFGPGLSPRAYIDRFHALGPRLVVLTMGKQGILVSEQGEILGHVPSRPVPVADATGAGDSFWAGFIVGLAEGRSPLECVLFGREVVELKLRTVGPLPATLDRAALWARVQL